MAKVRSGKRLRIVRNGRDTLQFIGGPIQSANWEVTCDNRSDSVRRSHTDWQVSLRTIHNPRAPFLLPNVRGGYKYGDQKTVDALIHDGLWCAFENWPMGDAAEHIAVKCGVGRADQDRFSAQSHQRAAAAWERGDFAAEIVPV